MDTTDDILTRPLPASDFVHPVHDSVGAVVIGGDYQGLGIVRSLGRQGVPVCVIDDEYSISRFSRYSKSFVGLSGLRDPHKIVGDLIATGKRLGLEGWVLYPTRDELVAAISKNRAELSQVFRVPTPGWECVKWAWDKRNTYRLAEQLGIPVPATYYPENSDQLAQINNIEPPFAIKPAIKEHFFYATRAKAWRANSHSELKILFNKASALTGSGEIMVQDLIPGSGSQQFSYCAFFRNGQAVGKMVVRRSRQHPLEFGRASTYVETVDIPVLEELSERFLRAIDYYGLVEMEYKLDPRDSQYKLLDVNARTWGYHALGAAAGVDFSYLLYRDQVGLPVSAVTGLSGTAWVRTVTDFPAAVMAILSGDTDFKSYIRSVRRCNVEAVFSAKDPLPGLAEIALLPYLAIKRGF
jgi:predicted ATP-grasp superfamily ATP-dependent carboligase